jgi:TRAP-type mannitol/chloroaromatic compound transport system substrate-binding protein
MTTSMTTRAVKRRDMLKGAALGAGAAAASAFPAPAIAQGLIEWQMVTTWPPGFPGLGTGADRLAAYIGAASGGRLTVKVHGAGEIVPPFESIDAVGNGTVEMGHGAPYYWKGKLPATQFLSALPFGLTTQEQNAWFALGGGQEIADRIYGELNCKFFYAGNTAAQMGGWYNREINGIDDFNGLKIRMPGLGGAVLQAAGATVVTIPGGEIPTAMASGDLDAVDWVGPYNDLAFGLQSYAKYYYYPGWHEPSGPIDCFVNLDAWNALDDDLKAVVEVSVNAANLMVQNEFVARNCDSLDSLINEHNVDIRSFSDPTLEALAKLSIEVVDEAVGDDALSREAYESIKTFRQKASAWSTDADLAFLKARALAPAWS